MFQQSHVLGGLAVVLLSAGLLHAQEATMNEAATITPAQREAVRAARQELLQQPRGLIFNSDGCDATHLADAPTPHAFYEARSTGLIGSQVDTIAYCPISAGFGLFTHRTEVGQVLTSKAKFLENNTTAALHAQGTDPLQLSIEFGQQHDMEVFFSMRMNDTHDVAHTPEDPYPLFPKWKGEHPEMLFGTREDRPKHGRWSAVDYGKAEVRELAYRFIEEACRKYAIDGIELDFLRHTQLLGRVAQTGVGATQEELDQMTALMRRIRRMTEREAVRRGGEPYLIAVRVPDSVEAARWLGIDLERWMAEGLADIFIFSGYFRFNPWQESVELAHRYGVKAYAGLSESRVRTADGKREPLRPSRQSYRARAAQAWQAGVDGIYSFNEYSPDKPYMREIGRPETLAGLDKIYFASVRGPSSAAYWYADGLSYFNRPTLTPKNPISLAAGESAALEVFVGDDLASHTGTAAPTVTLRVQLESMAEADALQVAFNDQTLTGGQKVGNKLIFELNPADMQEGFNRFELTLSDGASQALQMQDLQVLIDYPQDDTPWPDAAAP